MAKRGAHEVAFFLVDGFDLKGVQTQFGFDIESVFEESHGLGPTPGDTVRWKESLATGTRTAALSQQGFYDDEDGSIHEALNAQQSVSRIVAFGVSGNAAGRKMTILEGAYGGKYTRLSERNALHKANADYTVSGEVDEGVILLPHASVIGDVNTEADSVDNGASSGSGGVGYVAATDAGLFDLDGYDDVVAIIRHSSDDITFVDLITFDPITAAGAQRQEVAGTVDRYLAVDVAFTGAGTSPVVPMVVGFARRAA